MNLQARRPQLAQQAVRDFLVAADAVGVVDDDADVAARLVDKPVKAVPGLGRAGNLVDVFFAHRERISYGVGPAGFELFGDAVGFGLIRRGYARQEGVEGGHEFKVAFIRNSLNPNG